jgi:hypothetical protein
MTQIINRRPDRAPVLSILPTPEQSSSLPVVTLAEVMSGRIWELSIADKKLGTVHRVPSWICDDVFESDPPYVFECHPYGYCATKAEAIGRLFTGWLVATEIADPDVWQAEPKETGLPDYP